MAVNQTISVSLAQYGALTSSINVSLNGLAIYECTVKIFFVTLIDLLFLFYVMASNDLASASLLSAVRSFVFESIFITAFSPLRSTTVGDYMLILVAVERV